MQKPCPVCGKSVRIVSGAFAAHKDWRSGRACAWSNVAVSENTPEVKRTSDRAAPVQEQAKKPSQEIYSGLQSAYDHFNRKLFNGELPQAMIVLHRKRGAHGYFGAKRFSDRNGEATLDEIALNPSSLMRDEETALSTLVHEMCHLWQHHFGKPSRGGYHNSEWAAKMESVGLIPSDTGEEGGKMTGQRVSHYIADGGAYEAAYRNWRTKGCINWAAHPVAAKPNKSRNKTRYQCGCDPPNTIYGKPDLRLKCLQCKKQFKEGK